MIELENLVKNYGNFTALNQLCLSIPRGELFGFIGPNGAGKTTTIKIMAGVIAPDSGSVNIGGVNMLKEPEKAKHKIGFIPDRPYLYEKLTGMEFLRFIADLYGVDGDKFNKKAGEGLEIFSLDSWQNELIESYSHGMKQRLIMIAALVHDPEVIIVDEPMVGLDPAAIRVVKKLFRDLVAQGVTIFMSTHTLSIAQEICDRIGVIHNGSLIATGTPRELMDKAGAKDEGKSADLEKVFINLIR